MVAKIVFIAKDYFAKNAGFVEMLNAGDVNIQSTRLYLSINSKFKGNSFYLPLRKSVNLDIGRIGYHVPSSTRTDAGLDYRKALIVNDCVYVQGTTSVPISSSQMNRITKDLQTIENSFINYVKGYIKAARKKREKIDRLYKYSTLHNFHIELGIDEHLL